MALIAFISLIIACPALAMKPPSEYGYNQCELIAKDFQKEFGGSFVFIQPLQADGSYNLCDFCGHWINKKYISGNEQEYFFDWSTQQIFSSEIEIQNYWFESTGNNVKIFDLSQEHPPFAIIWHY